LRMAIDNVGNTKMGDGVWTNYANVDNAGVLTFEGTASINEPLSILAATTSAELAGVISDEIGAGKLRFDTSVTAKTTTATLTPAEAGTILVSAASAYTITLPTAVGNTGLTYHFKKTDANYNLITLDGDGTETINYKNSTSAPVLTYARLNTYCAEVTVVSDGSNWQVISETMGQVPECYVYLGAAQENIPDATYIIIDYTDEETDIGSNFNNTTRISGTADGTVANHLQDDGETPFVVAMQFHRVKNTTDTTYAYITAVNDAGDVTLSADIFVNGEGYEILYSQFVVPVSGKYEIHSIIEPINFVEYKEYRNQIWLNSATTPVTNIKIGPSRADTTYFYHYLYVPSYTFSKGDVIEIRTQFKAGVSTVDIHGVSTNNTSLYVRLVSKD